MNNKFQDFKTRCKLIFYEPHQDICNITGALCREQFCKPFKREILFDRCRKKYSIDTQLRKLAEESRELEEATNDLLYKKLGDRFVKLSHLAEEIADVELMLGEIKFCMPDLNPLIDQWTINKFTRLEARLEK